MRSILVCESINDIFKPKELSVKDFNEWKRRNELKNLDFDGVEFLSLDKNDDQIIYAKDGNDINFSFDLSEDCNILEDAHIIWNKLFKTQKEEIAEIIVANIERIDKYNDVSFNDSYWDMISILRIEYGDGIDTDEDDEDNF